MGFHVSLGECISGICRGMEDKMETTISISSGFGSGADTTPV